MGIIEIISHLQNLATVEASKKRCFLLGGELETLVVMALIFNAINAKVLAYQIISRLILQEPISPWSIAPLAVHPTLLALFAICRRLADLTELARSADFAYFSGRSGAYNCSTNKVWEFWATSFSCLDKPALRSQNDNSCPASWKCWTSLIGKSNAECRQLSSGRCMSGAKSWWIAMPMAVKTSPPFLFDSSL